MSVSSSQRRALELRRLILVRALARHFNMATVRFNLILFAANDALCCLVIVKRYCAHHVTISKSLTQSLRRLKCIHCHC